MSKGKGNASTGTAEGAGDNQPADRNKEGQPMPRESPKLKRLRELRQLLANARMKPQDMRRTVVGDTDGAMVRLDAEEAVAALDRRIAAEEATAAEGKG